MSHPTPIQTSKKQPKALLLVKDGELGPPSASLQRQLLSGQAKDGSPLVWGRGGVGDLWGVF